MISQCSDFTVYRTVRAKNNWKKTRIKKEYEILDSVGKFGEDSHIIVGCRVFY